MSSKVFHFFNFIFSEVEFREGGHPDRNKLCDFIITEFEDSQGLPALFNVEGFEILYVVVFGVEADEVGQCGH